MDQDETPLDRAYAAMAGNGHEDAPRLRYYETLAATEVFLLLNEEQTEDGLAPTVFDLDEGSFILCFDREYRLADFAGGPAPYASLPGRALVTLASRQNLGVGMNLGVADGEMLLPPGTVAWLANVLSQRPEQDEDRIAAVHAPSDASEALIRHLDSKLARCAGLAECAYLVLADYNSGRTDLAIVIMGAIADAQESIASAVSEITIFGAASETPIDVIFAEPTEHLLPQLARVGFRFDIPSIEINQGPSQIPPGSDPDRPPKLR